MGDALTATIVAALLAIAPASGAGTPAPAPTEPPLREIGHVHATTAFCKTALDRAASGIDIVLQNDVEFARAEFALRRIDLDSNDLVKFKNTKEINARYAALRNSALTGNGVLKELKAQAAEAPTEDQKTALLAFANALDGALARQKRLADDIGKFVVYVDNHPPLPKAEHERLEFLAIASQNYEYAPHPAEGPLIYVPDMLSDIAKQAATELEQRQAPIFADEDDAARKIDPAFAGC